MNALPLKGGNKCYCMNIRKTYWFTNIA